MHPRLACSNEDIAYEHDSLAVEGWLPRLKPARPPIVAMPETVIIRETGCDWLNVSHIRYLPRPMARHETLPSHICERRQDTPGSPARGTRCFQHRGLGLTLAKVASFPQGLYSCGFGVAVIWCNSRSGALCGRRTLNFQKHVRCKGEPI